MFTTAFRPLKYSTGSEPHSELGLKVFCLRKVTTQSLGGECIGNPKRIKEA